MSQSHFRDVCVVSSYGRGHWISAALANKGHKVTMVDVSPSMGRWAPEDWEGPFGYFHTELMSPLQIECLNEQDYDDTVDEGFTLWLKSGPMDMKGPVSQHLHKEMNLLENLGEYVSLNEHNDVSAVKRELDSNPFSRTWLVYMAYNLATNHFDVSKIDVDEKHKPLPLLSPLSVRRVSRRGWDMAMEWCESKGVEVVRHGCPVDISSRGRQISDLEVEGDWSGVVSARQYVWMLTGEETQRFNEKVCKTLYPKGVLKCAWSWVRFRFSLGEAIAHLPQKVVMLDDIYLPWTHENLCLMQKAVNGVDADVWIRIPSQHRFQRGYLEELGEKIKSIFRQRIPEIKPEVLNMPQDYLYEEKELGPCPFPVYDSEEFNNFDWVNFKNLQFESPEQWSPQDWSGQMLNQKKTYKTLLRKLEVQTPKPAVEVQP